MGIFGTQILKGYQWTRFQSSKINTAVLVAKVPLKPGVVSSIGDSAGLATLFYQVIAGGLLVVYDKT